MARKVTLAEDSAFRHHGAYRHRNHLRRDLVHGIVKKDINRLQI